ncbi:phosphoribosylanthranilate isomerase [Pontivivens nitratireducens]|uniref:N-(5'-phosphoribosyl)anthranilate isomerase n=1 Tax=Pontivivens nitratireducens TaxID=2758038 RepID=A0A6G7VPR4_9RHOB|nr:phosphoribosylanthranilate isomerase [Pontibrevibacter nitratireducens]QIK41866.1 phosphoribosylanthranilate isomerase [Pontibrevibacter nitratireducens]
MTSAIRTKICGLTTADGVAAAVDAGAAYVGFVFFAKSPRNVDIETARNLAADVPPGVCKVALVVNADDATLDAITDRVPLDMLQLHGSETPERVSEIKARYGLPVMKAVGIRNADDLTQIDVYAEVADQLLIDAKAPKGADLPGGNGLAFDWSLLSGRRWPRPWMLAGGLTPDNAMRAANLTGANQLDVSSGVETAPGIKDADKIAAFVAALGPQPPKLF